MASLVVFYSSGTTSACAFLKGCTSQWRN